MKQAWEETHSGQESKDEVGRAKKYLSVI